MRGPSYDFLMRPLERWSLRRLRRRLLARASGRVLDVGIGTGINLEHYPPGTVVVGVEPDASMRRRAERRAGLSASIQEGDALRLEFPDQTFDTVVFTLVLCSVPDPQAALLEARRVLKRGGRLLLLEHVRPSGAAGAAADALTPIWSRVSGGCRLNRSHDRTLKLLEFERETEQRFWRGAGRLWAWRRPR